MSVFVLDLRLAQVRPSEIIPFTNNNVEQILTQPVAGCSAGGVLTETTEKWTKLLRFSDPRTSCRVMNHLAAGLRQFSCFVASSRSASAATLGSLKTRLEAFRCRWIMLDVAFTLSLLFYFYFFHISRMEHFLALWIKRIFIQ